jgi:hypothetical protein
VQLPDAGELDHGFLVGIIPSGSCGGNEMSELLLAVLTEALGAALLALVMAAVRRVAVRRPA